MFKVKEHDDGTIERFRGCWVANGMQQVEGSDYTHTFSLVVKANSIRLVLTLDSSDGSTLCQRENKERIVADHSHSRNTLVSR